MACELFRIEEGTGMTAVQTGPGRWLILRSDNACAPGACSVDVDLERGETFAYPCERHRQEERRAA
jgi:hypothetical protein